MFGAMVGDICGSVYEFNNHKTENVDEIILIRPDSFFTDDSVLTAAVAEACLYGGSYGASIHQWGRRYPEVGYGAGFALWLQSDSPEPSQQYRRPRATARIQYPNHCQSSRQ